MAYEREDPENPWWGGVYPWAGGGMPDAGTPGGTAPTVPTVPPGFPENIPQPPPPPAPVPFPDRRGDRNAGPPDQAPDGWEWYWHEAPDGAGQWTLRRTGGGGPGSGPTGSGGDVEPFTFADMENWNWPTFNPRALPTIPDAPTFAPFQFERFTAPTMEEAEQNPGYAFARGEMQKALQNRYFAQGLGRTPNAYNAILKNTNAFANQNYDNVFNRNLDVHRTNEGNRFTAFNQNNDNLFRTWEGNRDLQMGLYDRGYAQDRDRFGFEFDASKFDANAALQRWITRVNAAVAGSRPPE